MNLMGREKVRFGGTIVLACGLVALLCLGIDSIILALNLNIGFRAIILPLVVPFGNTVMVGISKSKYFSALHLKWFFVSLLGNVLGGAVGVVGMVLGRSFLGFLVVTFALAINFFCYDPFDKETRSLGEARGQ